jgi:branched-chain amino acid transport system substrate-binding protein
LDRRRATVIGEANSDKPPGARGQHQTRRKIVMSVTNLSRRTLIKGAGGAALLTGVGMPAILRAQSDAIRIGHLTPLTGFLGPLGEYGVMGIKLAQEEINAAGGVLGRKVDLVMEDSVNPQTASAKAERLIERDKVVMIIGEISSASGLAIGQVANRLKAVFINTGCNSDALRGASCNPYMFHIEAANSMYVEAAGRYFLRDNLVKGKKWYSLTADYAFGHDLLKVAKRFMEANGGQFAADELVPTDATDFSPYLLKIRQARPDVVVSNLAGNQITNFMKQYTEFGLQFPVAGFAFDTVVAWGAGKGNFSGIWPLVWHHLVDTPSSKKYVEAFSKKYGKPPDNQSWGDYNSLKIVAQSMAETKSADPQKLAEHLRKGAKFDVMKAREAHFRPYDNQMVMEMYAIRAKTPDKMKDQWDIYEPLGTVPGPNEDMEVLAPPKDGTCKIA